MPYIDQNLLPDEKILFRTKKHYIIFLIPAVWTLFALFFSFSNDPFIVKFSMLPGIIAIFSWGYAALEYQVSDFAVTNLRVMLREGFLIRHTDEMRLSTIAQVTVNQSLLGQWLNYGTIIINSFGGESDPFSQIAFPFRFQREVQQIIFKS